VRNLTRFGDQAVDRPGSGFYLYPVETDSLAESVLAWTYLFLSVGIPVSVAVRLAAALLSRRILGSVVRHPVAHALWFAIGVAAISFLLAGVSASK